VISTFVHKSKFALVTNARFTPRPMTCHENRMFSFERCWANGAWDQDISRAMFFRTRSAALAYLRLYAQKMEVRLRDRGQSHVRVGSTSVLTSLSCVPGLERSTRMLRFFRCDG
jgi:hypothetical protein